MAESLANLQKDNDTICSTDEHIIGYVNESGTVKPLYEKTWTNIVTPATSTQGIGSNSVQSLGVTIGKVYGMGGIADIGDGRMMVLPYALPLSSNYQAVFLSARIFTNSYSANPNCVEIYNSNPGWNNLPVILTLKYTK